MTQNGSATFTWDAESRMASSVAGGVTTNYTYDANGMRVRKHTDPNNFTEYIYFGSQVIAEKQVIAGGAPVWTDYIFAGSKRVAKAPAEAITTNTEYYHSDHLGTATWMTNASGTQIYSATYLPYGHELNPSGSTTNHYKFTGKERDTFSGTSAPPLDYFGARYYGSTMGRFLSPDPSSVSIIPSNPQSWNRYEYARNNALVYVDRNGLWPFYIHNQIIDFVFYFLSHSERTVLKVASSYVDRPSNQGPQNAYQHGMSYEGQADPIGDTERFIHEQVEAAVRAQIGLDTQPTSTFPTAPTARFALAALYHLGQAIHAATDTESPPHRGFQLWHGTRGIRNKFRALAHGLGEADTVNYEIDLLMARVQAARVWSLFVRRLTEEAEKAGKDKEKIACTPNACPKKD